MQPNLFTTPGWTRAPAARRQRNLFEMKDVGPSDIRVVFVSLGLGDLEPTVTTLPL